MSFKKLALVSLVIFFVIVYFLFFNGGMFAGFTTKYSAGFTFEKLYNIKTGSTPEQVYEILGDPFSKAKIGSIPACDYYSAPTNEWNDFLGWNSVRVCYNLDGKVDAIAQNIFF